MRLAGIGAVLLAALVCTMIPAQAQWCSDHEGHGRCLACQWSYSPVTLRLGEPMQPFVCADMARDRKVTFILGGTGTYLGPHLRDRIGLTVRRNGRYFRRVWGPAPGTMPVGPVSVPIGSTRDRATVAPVLELSTCRSAAGGSGTCSFVFTGKICVTGLC